MHRITAFRFFKLGISQVFQGLPSHGRTSLNWENNAILVKKRFYEKRFETKFKHKR